MTPSSHPSKKMLTGEKGWTIGADMAKPLPNYFIPYDEKLAG